MRCDTVRQMVEEDVEISPSLRVHLDSCSACKEYLRSWQAVRAGLIALGVESPPEPSIGFTKRVMNRIENAREEIHRSDWPALCLRDADGGADAASGAPAAVVGTPSQFRSLTICPCADPNGDAIERAGSGSGWLGFRRCSGLF